MQSLPLRVYVAGPYSADNVLDVLHNIRRGIRASTQIFTLGFAPFSPWLDYHFLLQVTESEAKEVTVKDFYQYSLAWLAVSDALYVLPDSEESHGTQEEIKYAESLGIPVFRDVRQLCLWREDLHENAGR